MILKLPPIVTVKFKDLGRGKAEFFYSETFGKRFPQKYIQNTFEVVKVIEKIAPGLKVNMKGKTISVKGVDDIKLIREFLGAEFLAWTSMAGMTLRDIIGAMSVSHAMVLNAKHGGEPFKLKYDDPPSKLSDEDLFD